MFVNKTNFIHLKPQDRAVIEALAIQDPLFEHTGGSLSFEVNETRVISIRFGRETVFPLVVPLSICDLTFLTIGSNTTWSPENAPTREQSSSL